MCHYLNTEIMYLNFYQRPAISAVTLGTRQPVILPSKTTGFKRLVVLRGPEVEQRVISKLQNDES